MTFIQLIISILILLFLVGFVLMVVGKIQRRKPILKLGCLFFLIPFSIIIFAIAYKIVEKKRSENLTQNDLIGNYVLINSNSSNENKVQLKLYENGKFEISDLLANQICERGKYSLYANEVWFRCDNHSSIAKIERGFINLNLKFNFHSADNKEKFTVQKIQD
ncbi:hypothetical protein ACI6PS_00600 [Flavobacterium sp. PLA-1-15]|uniref:hypothetical protein n=1 Tax=Flavobacterium sp. PLA-1-15 TaxID=3380533 RepID=UPI003B7D3E63